MDDGDDQHWNAGKGLDKAPQDLSDLDLDGNCDYNNLDEHGDNLDDDEDQHWNASAGLHLISILI